MNMMNGSSPAMTLLCALCCIGMIALAVGLIFLVVWAVKNLTPAKLRSWGIGLAVAGGLVCLLACSLMGPRMGMMKFRAGEMVSMNGKSMMDCMMKEDEGMGMMMKHDGMEMMDHSMAGMTMQHDDPMSMSMADMSSMLEGKTGDAFDKAFLEGMIPHHQGAIDMARLAETNAKQGQIREMAIEIITTQQNEIDMMNQWMKDWGYVQ